MIPAGYQPSIPTIPTRVVINCRRRSTAAKRDGHPDGTHQEVFRNRWLGSRYFARNRPWRLKMTNQNAPAISAPRPVVVREGLFGLQPISAAGEDTHVHQNGKRSKAIQTPSRPSQTSSAKYQSKGESRQCRSTIATSAIYPWWHAPEPERLEYQSFMPT